MRLTPVNEVIVATLLLLGELDLLFELVLALDIGGDHERDMVDEIADKGKSRALEKKLDVAPGNYRSLFDASGVENGCGLRGARLLGDVVFYESGVGLMVKSLMNGLVHVVGSFVLLAS